MVCCKYIHIGSHNLTLAPAHIILASFHVSPDSLDVWMVTRAFLLIAKAHVSDNALRI